MGRSVRPRAIDRVLRGFNCRISLLYRRLGIGIRRIVELSNLKSYLWKAANILPLLFFKRICDVWNEETADAAEIYGDVNPNIPFHVFGSGD